jgi:hypothetical protein
MREKRNAYKFLVEKPEGKRPPGRSRHRWENNIILDLREMSWIRLAQNRDQWLVPSKAVTSLRVL